MKPCKQSKGAFSVARLFTLLSRRDVLWQILFVAVLASVAWAIVHTASNNLERLSVKSGYGFLWKKTSFELGESLISYTAGDTYFRAFTVGVLNTVKVAILGIFCSTIVGLVIALGQLSKSRLIARLCRGYIEVIRNIPLLLQLIFWHTLLTTVLPTIRNAVSPVPGVFVTNRGVFLPALQPNPVYGHMALAVLGGVLAALVLRYVLKRYRPDMRAAWLYAGLILGVPVLLFLFAGAPLALDLPQQTKFSFTGGLTVTPEFLAMLLGLSLYTGSFNAEIIRGGILSIPKGQGETGLALGLTNRQVMRLILIPQALRVIIPPMSNSYLNLTKESSLAVAIGYPELVRVANITLAETSQSIECISIIMLVYLLLSLLTAMALNLVNTKAALEER
jgi:general L-amino acid transport system permease protein